MFATPFTTFHTLLSLAAIVAGAFVMVMLVKNRRPDIWTLGFFVTMIATDVTGFMFPFTKLLPSHITGIISLVLLALALLAQYVLHFAGAWRWIYAVTMGLAVYLNFFVLVTQLFLKVPALHALAPEDFGWVHSAEGPDDMPGHVKAMLNGVSLHVPVRAGALALGTWQGIYLVEHRARPHRREVVLQFVGSRS